MADHDRKLDSRTATADAGQGPRQHLFRKGRSGNPRGRPIGSGNVAKARLKAVFDDAAGPIGDKVVELALAGDLGALKVCLDRILPVRRDEPVFLEMPKITTAEDLPEACGTIVGAVAGGEITPAEALHVFRVIETAAGVLRAADAAAQPQDQVRYTISDEPLSAEEWEATYGKPAAS
ncbi:MAG: DUF5681 domain-containing protein [Hyphomicrobiales bacterium]